MTDAELRLPAGVDIVGIRAGNPGPFSLTGTNSWVAGREPAWLIDPGPSLPEHVDALSAEIGRRGGLGGIALTHDHYDHAEAVDAVLRSFPGTQVAAARGEGFQLLRDGDRFGPLEVIATPGHAPDHLAFVVGSVAMTGDAVLGTGSVFIAADPGAMASYLTALEALRQRRLVALAPGHGPVVHDPEAKLGEYISHRLERERRLISALGDGRRTVDALLDAAWSDVPDGLRPAAAITLRAHLDKLQREDRLPEGVELPPWPVDWLPHV